MQFKSVATGYSAMMKCHPFFRFLLKRFFISTENTQEAAIDCTQHKHDGKGIFSLISLSELSDLRTEIRIKCASSILFNHNTQGCYAVDAHER